MTLIPWTQLWVPNSMSKWEVTKQELPEHPASLHCAPLSTLRLYHLTLHSHHGERLMAPEHTGSSSCLWVLVLTTTTAWNNPASPPSLDWSLLNAPGSIQTFLPLGKLAYSLNCLPKRTVGFITILVTAVFPIPTQSLVHRCLILIC